MLPADVVAFVDQLLEARGRAVMTRPTDMFGGERDGLWLVSSDGGRGDVDAYVEEQLPYGEFSAGRFAWLLADIVLIVPPEPARGHQGLWEWSP